MCFFLFLGLLFPRFVNNFLQENFGLEISKNCKFSLTDQVFIYNFAATKSLGFDA